MELLQFNPTRCDLCGRCIQKCPFQALYMGEKGIEVNDKCKMCSVCIKVCPQEAIHFEQKAESIDKTTWNDILIFVEQERGEIHPVVLELIGEAKKLAKEVDYKVHAVIVGGKGTNENAKKLLSYDVTNVYTYEHEGFTYFKTDCYADAVADCIASVRPSVVLIGATTLGRSLAPRLSTRFHTGLTADCTALKMKSNTDLVQIRPAFGGNIMAQILISNTRPQFATVRYKVMDKAEIVEHPNGTVIPCETTDFMVRSRIQVLEAKPLVKQKSIEEEEVLVVAGRGVKDEKGIEMLEQLAKGLGGQLCYTRPLVEAGYGDASHQIGLSGRTVKPKLIITFGVSGAIQFASCMNGAECIIAVDSDPDALIFNIANYSIVDDLYLIVPRLLQQLETGKESE